MEKVPFTINGLENLKNEFNNDKISFNESHTDIELNCRPIALKRSFENIIQKLLKSLGFIKAGLHKTKNITLYTLGNVKFIINSEIVSDQNLEEFNPYAFGLVVDNVKSTLKRCEVLHVNNVKDFYLKNKLFI